MRWLRGTANAVLVATLVRPVARRLIARTRRRAREHPASPLLIPVEELLEAALLAELAASRAEREPAPDGAGEPALDETREEHAQRGVDPTLLWAGALAAVVVIASVAVVAVVRRRRRRAPQSEADRTDWVAVPVEAPADVPAEADQVDASMSLG